MEHSKLEERTETLQIEIADIKKTLRTLIYLIVALMAEVPITVVM